MRAEPAAATMVPSMATVAEVRRELDGIVTVGFELPIEMKLPAPGQFAMLWVPGIGEVPISYSGIGPGRWVEHTVRAVGATTVALCALEAGDAVGVRAPFGRGWQLTELVGRDVIVIAGGLGLAPLRPVVDAWQSLGASSVRLAVGARSPDAILYADQLSARWAMLSPQVTVDHAERGWDGGVGPLRASMAGALEEPGEAAALLCGPEIMMSVLSRQLQDVGLEAERIQISLERSMHCGVGLCGHCQLGPLFTCVDGPVVDWSDAEALLAVRER